jgi:hypothetical protein
MSWDRRIPRNHHDGAASDVGQLTPPDFGAPGIVAHEAAADSRKEARSPHSSGSLNGCASYAA